MRRTVQVGLHMYLSTKYGCTERIYCPLYTVHVCINIIHNGNKKIIQETYKAPRTLIGCFDHSLMRAVALFLLCLWSRWTCYSL